MRRSAEERSRHPLSARVRGGVDQSEDQGRPRTRSPPGDARGPRGSVAVSINPRPMAVTEIARGPATPAFTGTAIAMRVGNELWLGWFFADPPGVPGAEGGPPAPP